jgi:hypothetical protein
MNALAMAVALFASNATYQDKPSVPGAIDVKIEPASIERIAAEFINVCVRPMWEPAETRAAAKKSDLQYIDKSDARYPWQVLLEAQRAYINLSWNLARKDGTRAQCELSMHSTEPRTGQQFIEMLTDIIEPAVSAKVRRDTTHNIIEWDLPDGKSTAEIYLVAPGAEVGEEFWIISDKIDRPAAGDDK